MYEKFSNTIKTPGNNNENSNNLTNFKHNIKKVDLWILEEKIKDDDSTFYKNLIKKNQI